MGLKNRIVTPRLVLRRWKVRDKHDLYEYAQHKEVGPIAGWPLHSSMEESARIIRSSLSARGNYAITLRDTGKVIGGIGMHSTSLSQADPDINALELGYVLNPRYWGNEYIPEAALHYMYEAFSRLYLDAVISACFDFNERSRRVFEKCGFEYMFQKHTMIEQLDFFKGIEQVYRLSEDTYWQLFEDGAYDKYF
jgi:Acetyltransferases, including N-acetylases of ribosomal proteins